MKRIKERSVRGGEIVIVVALAGLLPYVGVTLSWPPVADYFTVQSYHQGQCTILAKQLLLYSSYNQDTGNEDTQYAPDLTFLVQDTSHKNYRAEGYGIDQYLAGMQDAQAILDSYHTEGSYPCWYDPANPSHAVLTREIANWALLISGTILLLIGLGIPVGAGLIMKRLLR